VCSTRVKRAELSVSGIHSESLCTHYNCIRITRGMRWAGRVARTVEMRNQYKILFGKPEGKRYFG
jgi:hypothetical protein